MRTVNNKEAEEQSRHKARLIVQGMLEQVDDTYSPTPSSESARICLTLASHQDWRRGQGKHSSQALLGRGNTLFLV